jgi:predicted ATPase/DNA-binding winged helix-turn-helix (wHTH) protein
MVVTSLHPLSADKSDRVGIDGEPPLRFGRFTVLRQARELFLDEQPREIGSRAFDLLMVLTERQGNVVSRREIIDLVWPDTYVDDVNLRVQVATLRRALGADRDIVKTVPGRGYLFAAEVSLATGRTNQEERSASDAPGLDPATVRTNITRPINALLGRARELAELETIIGQDRMVVLIGCGGVGKTRLAIELGLRQAESFPDGIWLIDLAPLTDPGAVISTTAAALGVQIGNPDTEVEAIASAIGQRQLLIFDNCEHLVAAVANLVGALLERAPGLSVLATSQDPLPLPIGLLYRLDPLELPPTGATEITDFAASVLFCERARAADRRFTATAGNAARIGEICRRLDGIPLALEMAAARLSLLGLDGLLAGLDARLKLLKIGARLEDARHHTLRSMVEWSHSLLDIDERRVFRRLAIFPSSFSLEAAADMAGDTGEDYWDLVDTLGRLVDKSLVTVEGNDPPRYRLLETLRIFAREQLTTSGEFQAIAQRHARFFADLFVVSNEVWETTKPVEWLQRYIPEFDNVQTALDWGIGKLDHKDIVVRLAGASGRLWLNSDRRVEGWRYLEQANHLVDDDTPLNDVARLVEQIGYLCQNIDNARSKAALEQAATLYRKLNDKHRLAAVLCVLGVNSARAGRPEEGKRLLDEALELLGFTDNKRTLSSVLAHLGQLARLSGDNVGARRYYEQALEIFREMKDDFRHSLLRRALAELEFAEGAVDRAIALAREDISRLRKSTKALLASHALINFASYLAFGGEQSEARGYAEEALLLERDAGSNALWACLQLWALLAALGGHYSEAARLIGFVDAAVAQTGEIREPTERLIYDRLMGILDAEMSAADRHSCRAQGARWSEKWAVDFTFNHIIPGSPPAA